MLESPLLCISMRTTYNPRNIHFRGLSAHKPPSFYWSLDIRDMFARLDGDAVGVHAKG